MLSPLLLVNKGLALIRRSFFYALLGRMVHHFVHGTNDLVHGTP